MLFQDGIEGARTKAELHRAVLRTADAWGGLIRPTPAFSHGAGTSRRVASPGPAGFLDNARGDDAERFSIAPFFHEGHNDDQAQQCLR